LPGHGKLKSRKTKDFRQGGQPMETWQAFAERVPPENPDYVPQKP